MKTTTTAGKYQLTSISSKGTPKSKSTKNKKKSYRERIYSYIRNNSTKGVTVLQAERRLKISHETTASTFNRLANEGLIEVMPTSWGGSVERWDRTTKRWSKVYYAVIFPMP